MKPVIYKSTFDEQVKWGSCADPRKVLTEGGSYEADRIEAHSWHTKLFLVGYEGMGFPLYAFTDEDGKRLEIEDFS